MERRRGKCHVLLKDVAKATGYSINTVSRALRRKDDINHETGEKIRRAAQELGYINNTIASSLRLGYTNTIAVILGDIANPHFASITRGVEERARSLGYASFLLNTDESEELERKAIETALNKNVDGVLLCPVQRTTGNISFLRSTGVPFVLIGRRCPELETDYVICNDHLGGYQATRHLLSHGHRDILMLHGPQYISSVRERVAGYRQALAEFRVPLQPRLIREVSITGSGCAAVLDQLEAEGTRYTAVFAFSDMLAWETWAHQRKLGRRVPEDCSIVGFDHIQRRVILPFQLDTVGLVSRPISLAAVDLLVQRIQDGPAPTHTGLILDTQLIPGDTVVSLTREKA